MVETFIMTFFLSAFRDRSAIMCGDVCVAITELGEMGYMIYHYAQFNEVTCQSPPLRLKLTKCNTTSILKLEVTQLSH